MSKQKKLVRERFRDAVFKRDNHKCRVCFEKNSKLDAHHITDRNEMPNGGYCKENGISLCESCHEKANNSTQQEFMLKDFIQMIYIH